MYGIILVSLRHARKENIHPQTDVPGSFGQIAVDDSHHVITGAMADFADKADSQCLPAILGQTIENLKGNQILMDQIVADTGYSSVEALRFCEQNHIDPYIPNTGRYKPAREGFEYDAQNDRYVCTRGNTALLPFKAVTSDKKGALKKRVPEQFNRL